MNGNNNQVNIPISIDKGFVASVEGTGNIALSVINMTEIEILRACLQIAMSVAANLDKKDSRILKPTVVPMVKPV